MKIAWTKKAEEQPDQIFDFIAEDSPLYAYRTVQKIIGRVEKIPLYPFKGRMVPECEQDDIRDVFSSPISHHLHGKS